MSSGPRTTAGQTGGRSSVVALAAAIALGGPVALAGAAVHAHLVSSSPEDRESLSTSPPVIRLVFSEPVEAGLSHIVVWSARDSLEIRVRADSTDARILVGDMPHLAPAEYQLDWLVVSADGHPVEGSYRFTVLAPAGTPDTVPSLGPRAAHRLGAAGHADAPGSSLAAGVSAALRGLAMFTLVALAGWLLQIIALGVPSPRGAIRAALILATLTTAFLGAHFAAWLWHVSPPGRAPDLGAALGTGPGRVEALRIALVLLVLWAVGLARRPWIALTLALAAVLLSGATGHSAGISPRWSIPLKSLHLIAIAVWVGGVAWLAVAALDPVAFGASALRVSRMALGAVLVVGLTGVAQSALFLPDVSALFGSAYGRLVLAKVAGLAGLVAFGAWNRRRLLPRLDQAGGQAALRASTRRELALMLVVSLVAGVLAYVPPPPS